MKNSSIVLILVALLLGVHSYGMRPICLTSLEKLASATQLIDGPFTIDGLRTKLRVTFSHYSTQTDQSDPSVQRAPVPVLSTPYFSIPSVEPISNFAARFGAETTDKPVKYRYDVPGPKLDVEDVEQISWLLGVPVDQLKVTYDTAIQNNRITWEEKGRSLAFRSEYQFPIQFVLQPGESPTIEISTPKSLNDIPVWLSSEDILPKSVDEPSAATPERTPPPTAPDALWDWAARDIRRRFPDPVRHTHSAMSQELMKDPNRPLGAVFFRTRKVGVLLVERSGTFYGLLFRVQTLSDMDALVLLDVSHPETYNSMKALGVVLLSGLPQVVSLRPEDRPSYYWWAKTTSVVRPAARSGSRIHAINSSVGNRIQAADDRRDRALFGGADPK